MNVVLWEYFSVWMDGNIKENTNGDYLGPNIRLIFSSFLFFWVELFLIPYFLLFCIVLCFDTSTYPTCFSIIRISDSNESTQLDGSLGNRVSQTSLINLST